MKTRQAKKLIRQWVTDGERFAAQPFPRRLAAMRRYFTRPSAQDLKAAADQVVRIYHEHL